MTKFYRYLLAAGLMVSSLSVELIAHDDDDSHNRHCCNTPRDHQDDIVGVWLFNRDQGQPCELYGVRVFFADGTTVQHISSALSQLTQSSPHGDYFTINTGIWKKTGKHTYKVVDTGVWLKKNFPSADLHGIPHARIKTEFTFTINKDCTTADAKGWTDFFEVTDLTLKKFHTPKINPISFTAFARRLTFKP